MKKHVLGIFSLLFFLTAFSQAQVNVSANITSGCAPVSVNFSANIAGGTTYLWSFGDGGTSSTQNPSHTFNTAGYYYVYVDAYDIFNGYLGYGLIEISVGGAPDTIYMSADTACVGDEVSFYISNGLEYDSYTIDYGDGSATETNSWGSFYHEYTALGDYTATITTTDACGTFQVSNLVRIRNNVPISDVWLNISSTQACPGDEVDIWLEAPGSPDYIFDYGDGSVPSDENDHAYASPGVYTITAYVQNGCGSTATFTDQISVQTNVPIDPQTVFMGGWPNPQCPGSEVFFSTNSGYAAYQWDFGDGNSSSVQYPDHTYQAPGTYTYSVNITNGCGNDTTLFDVIDIQTGLPVGSIWLDAPDSVCPGEAFRLSGGPEEEAISWALGDGNTATGAEVLYAYNTPGTYTITMTVVNGCGSSAQSTHQIVVHPNVLPNISDYFINVFPEQVCPGDTVLFLSGPGGGTGTQYLWDYGDGNNSSGAAPGQLTLNGLTFDTYKHAYNTPGNYTTTIQITNGCGNSVSTSLPVSVGPGAAPEAGFLVDANAYNCLNEPVTFLGAGGDQYEWDFGDGTGVLTTYGTLQPVYHQFPNPGTYTVKLTVTNGCGQQDSDEAEVVIQDSKLNITTNGISANCGDENGLAIVSVTGGNAPYTFNWTNGDTGVIADSLSSGIYQVNITDDKGCTDFAMVTVSDVEAPTIVVNNVIDVTCFGGNNGAIDINLIGSSAPYTYTWSNGKFSEDINNLVAGPYDLIVEDANGCIAAKSVVVSQPTSTFISMAKVDAACGQNNGQATVNVSGSTGPYSFVWDNGSSNQSRFNLGAGVYNVTVIDGNGCLYQESVDISENGGPLIRVDSVINAGCGAGVNSIYITALAGTAPYSYNWTGGITTQDLIGVSPGTYSVAVSGSNGCRTVQTFQLDFETPQPQGICLVTVDPISQKNLLVWEKPASQGLVNSYNIYRESSQSGLYFQVGNVPYDSLSQFIDASADPSIRSWRYKITAVDSCGNESEFSNIHKTIHLTNNMGISGEVNLIWDYYTGMTYSTVNLWRYSDVDGWNMIQSMPSNLTSYTDLVPPAGASSLAYTLEAIPDYTCTSTRAVNHNTTRSNRTSAIQGPVLAVAEPMQVNLDMSLFPNPASNEVHIYFNAGTSLEETLITLYDMNGKVIAHQALSNMIGYQDFVLPLTDLDAGMYNVVLTQGNAITSKRLVVQQ